MQHTNLQHLRQLKLTGMANALATQHEQPGHYDGVSFDERLQLLSDAEQLERDQRKQERLLKAAKLKLLATAQGIDYSHPRGLKQSVMASLLQCHWISKHQNLLLTGPCGSGKTYLACALAHTACMKGFSVKYYRLSRLLLALRQAKADGTYSKLLIHLSKQDLLFLDDCGLEPPDTAQRNDVMEIMDDRNDARSTIIISQLPVDQWHQSIGDNTLADAILDALFHNAHRMPLKGASLRQLQPEI